MEYKIIPSILVETEDEFIEKIEMAEGFAEYVHWDIMDGQFVEGITFSNPKGLQNTETTLNIGVHLMVENPEDRFDELANAGADRVVVHAQVIDDLPEIVEKMSQYDFETGIALSTEVDIDILEDIIEDIDFVLVMTVVPGAAGQEMLIEELEKVKELREAYPDLNIGVDGGINMQTLKLAKDAGANYFSVNSAIFEAPDPANAYEVMTSMVQ